MNYSVFLDDIYAETYSFSNPPSSRKGRYALEQFGGKKAYFRLFRVWKRLKEAENSEWDPKKLQSVVHSMQLYLYGRRKPFSEQPIPMGSSSDRAASRTFRILSGKIKGFLANEDEVELYTSWKSAARLCMNSKYDIFEIHKFVSERRNAMEDFIFAYKRVVNRGGASPLLRRVLTTPPRTPVK